VGSTVGVAGALRRDERNNVRAFDQYLQVDWQLAERWSAISGLRHSRIRFVSRDGYVRPGNPDDSGAATYHATTPAVGLMFRARPQVNLYASYGHGFRHRRSPSWPIGAMAMRDSILRCVRRTATTNSV
jgi:iron complex outermembrane receptor protein